MAQLTALETPGVPADMVIQTSQPAVDADRDSHCPTNAAARQHLLTVNVEDYFQVGVFQKFISADNWYRFESRLQHNVEHVLNVLQQHDTKATFFVLGWTAEKEPRLIRSIADAGHEVAGRGYLHQPLLTLSRDQIRQDLTRSKDVLEDVTGQAVDGFRLSDGWLNRETLWLLDELAAAGYRYDSSLMPRQRDFADAPEWRHIREVQTEHGPIVEIPLSTMEIPGGWLPIAGGNYQRQIPDFLMRRLVDRAVTNEADPFVMYFQVWELDSEQPRLSIADRITQVRHYRKLGKYRRLLPQYLKRYQFTSVRDHARLEGSPLKPLKHHRPTPGRGILPSTNLSELNAPSPVHRPCEEFSCDSSAVDTVTADSCPAETESRRPKTDRTDVTIVIPCFNEEKSLSYLANTLVSVTDRLSDRWAPRILFVDDCSTDCTFDVLQNLFGDDPAYRIVRHDENKGVSAAIRTGIEHADTEIVCSMDCDCSYDPHELANMLPLLTDETAMVTASPYHKDGLVRNVPGWRLVLSRGLSALYQRLLKQPLATWTSCFRVYRRSRILDLPLKEDGFLGTAELAAQLVLQQRPIVEYPATLEVRLFGLSKMKTAKAILSHLRLLSQIAMSRFTGGDRADSGQKPAVPSEPRS